MSKGNEQETGQEQGNVGGYYDDIAGAPATGYDNYVLPGEYLVEVRQAWEHDSGREKGIRYNSIKVKIEKLRDPDNHEYEPGMTMTQHVKSSHQSGPSNLKNFVLALGQELFEEFTEKDVTGKFVQRVFTGWEKLMEECGRESVYLFLHALNQPTTKGGTFTKCCWYPPQEWTARQASAASGGETGSGAGPEA